MKTDPLISIVVVSYNSEKFLNKCIASIYRSDFKDFEVVVVDNGSFDGSANSIKKRFFSQPNFKLIGLEKNLGSSVGRNCGVTQANGQYLLFLDADTVIAKNCLSAFANFIKSHPNTGALHAKLLNLETPQFYDYAGDYLDPFGFLVDRAKGKKDRGDLDYVFPILSGKTAAVLVGRKAYDAVGGFDEDYFFMLEDTDFDWKLWLMGYQVLFLPQAVAYHGFQTAEKTKNKERYYLNVPLKYYGARNYLLTLIKNLGVKRLLRIVPLHILCWLVMALAFLFKGKSRESFKIMQGLGWNFINLPLVLRKRRQLQTRRVLSDSDLNFLFIPCEKVSHYLGKIVSYTND